MRVFSGLEEPFLDLSSLVVRNPHCRQATILWDVLQDVFRVELFALTVSGFHWQHDSMLISVYICCVKPCIFLRVKPAISNFLAPVHPLPSPPTPRPWLPHIGYLPGWTCPCKEPDPGAASTAARAWCCTESPASHHPQRCPKEMKNRLPVLHPCALQIRMWL